MSQSTIAVQPWRTLGLSPSFGFGDRLGVATPGHVRALAEHGGPIRPIFAQQSSREMQRTARTPQQVVDDAAAGMKAAGFSGHSGADADHLKTARDVEITAAAGFVFFTIDPSAMVDPRADTYDAARLNARFDALAGEVDWLAQYTGRTIRLGGGIRFDLTEQACKLAAVKYGQAINHAISLAGHIRRVQESNRRPFEIELSVDETPHPTTPAEHYIIADQSRRRGLANLVSLAPRFVGDFEKAVDYKGDTVAFQASLAVHAAIAAALGPYKLSLHSGSDKLSIYPALARETKGMFHVKTAGTSYLEALRVVARHDANLFRRVIELARQRYETDRATYHVSATLAGVPDGKSESAAELERIYLQNWAEVPPGKGFTAPGRQIVHCTFGSVLLDKELGPAVKQVVKENRATYEQMLAEHFGKHLRALREGM